jgi:hypothetical protein
MNSIAIGFIVFAFCFGGALLGMFLSTRLPEQHLSAESKNIANLGDGAGRDDDRSGSWSAGRFGQELL